MRNKLLLALCLTLFSIPTISFSQNISDYLILQDILPYKLEAPQKVVGGYIGGPREFDGAGVIAPTGHFYLDHSDKTYEVYYEGGSTLPSPTVQVTQHAGSDSDKWLLHEVAKSFRTYYGIPGDPYALRVIDGNTIIVYGSAGWAYRWASGNKVIQISYHDSQMEKPEPLEVVSAYLTKHPSTITAMTSADLRTDENKTTWIKDEMDRRLWLGDKWIARIETVGNLNELSSVVKSLNVFLDYKEKYYGISAENEKQTLSEYQLANNKAGIKTKLAEYKTWWEENKDKPINL